MKFFFHHHLTAHPHIVGIYNALVKSGAEVRLFQRVSDIIAHTYLVNKIILTDADDEYQQLEYIDGDVILLSFAKPHIEYDRKIDLNTIPPHVDTVLFGGGEPVDHFRFDTIIHTDHLSEEQCLQYLNKYPNAALMGRNAIAHPRYIGYVIENDYKYMGASADRIITGNKFYAPGFAYAGAETPGYDPITTTYVELIRNEGIIV